MTPRSPRAGKAGRDAAQGRPRPSRSPGKPPDESVAPWLSGEPSRWVIAVRAQPGARRSEAAGEHASSLKVRIDAPPVEGRANEALLRWIAGRLGLRAAQIALISGATSREKRVLVEAPIERAQIVERLTGTATS